MTILDVRGHEVRLEFRVHGHGMQMMCVTAPLMMRDQVPTAV